MEYCVCVIPARGGSKRIPKKNIKDFCGKPLIMYSIENAQKCGIFNDIIVSSDDDEILQIALNCGISALKRPAHLSDDYASTREVIIHVINCICALSAENALQNTLESRNLRMQGNVESQNTLESRNLWVCCLYATAPLLDFHALKNAFEMAKKEAKECYCFSAVEYDYSPFRAFTITQNRNKMLFEKHFTKRSQDLEKVYHDAGQFYFATAETWVGRENIFEDSLSFLLPPSRVQDIDTLDDWNLAELKFKRLYH